MLKNHERKQDTRRKIQLGGLVKKAGLENEPAAVLYGIFLEAKELLESNEAKKIKIRWETRGDIAFILD